jgi:hypothetical protein
MWKEVFVALYSIDGTFSFPPSEDVSLLFKFFDIFLLFNINRCFVFLHIKSAGGSEVRSKDDR